MPRIKPTDEQLRAQIEAVTAEKYPSDEIEARIASALISDGRFEATLSGDELSAVLRKLVYTMFGKHTLAGQGFNLVHNVATMQVIINASEAKVGFIVHIHKPITAFLKFKYCLVNDPVSANRRLRLKRDSLVIRENTRRFDIKAKAALAAINIEKIARQELSNPARIIQVTLPEQLEKHGLGGRITCIELALKDHHLELGLEGDFKPLSGDSSKDGDV
jgi:hypothetical protein